MHPQNTKDIIKSDLESSHIQNKYVPKTSEDSQNEAQKNMCGIQQNKTLTPYKTRHWTVKQNKIYLRFLEENAHLFRYKSVRRIKQIYSLLSQRMGGIKTPAQCKSHHQKMRKATEKGTIKQIMNYIKHKKLTNTPSSKLLIIPKIKQTIQKLNQQDFNYHLQLKKSYGKTCLNVTIKLDSLISW